MNEPSVLEDVVLFVVDCEHKTAPPAARGDEYAYSIGTRDILSGHIQLQSAKRVDQPTYKTWTARARPDSGDLILAREAPVGGVAYVNGHARLCLGQRTVLLRPNQDKVHPRYLHYLLLSIPVQQWMSDRATGSTVEHLNVADVRRIPLGALPSLEEQTRVAAALGALDDKIDANERLAECCDQLASAELSRLLQTSEEEGSLVVTRLGDVADVNLRTVKPSTGMLTYLDISSVSVGSAEPPTRMAWADAPSRARRGVANGDVLWSTVRPNRQSHCLLLDPPADLVVSTGFAVLTPRTVGPSFLYGISERKEFVEYLVSVAHGSAYPAVRADRFSDAPIQLPTMEALASYESSTMALRERAATARKESNVLFRLRDVLLRNLFSGALSISDGGSLLEAAV